MSAANLNIGGNVVVPEGSFQIGPFIINTSSPVFQDTVINLASGFNTITPAPGATFVILVFPPTNTIPITEKGVTGDTGVLLLKTGIVIKQLDPTQTTIGLTATGGTMSGVRLIQA